jgi:hypothetical protein
MNMRLEIDGRDATDDCADFTFGTPPLVYEEDNGNAILRFLGAQGFHLTLVDPSDWLRALVDGGAETHIAKLTSDEWSLTHTVQFRKEWDCADGTRKVFASLANERATIAKWIREPNAAQLRRE